MREIKFRAWDTINKHMMPHKYLDVMCKNIGKNNQFIYEQYTGLKDKNGAEIYEGDIVRHKGNGDPDEKNTFGEIHHVYGHEAKNMKGEVFYVIAIPCGFVLRHSSAWGKGVDDIPNQIINGYAVVDNHDLWNTQKWYEVIGNIHKGNVS